MPWVFTPELGSILTRVGTDVASVMGGRRTNVGNRDDAGGGGQGDEASWRDTHWDSTVHNGTIRGADIEMVSSKEEWAGPVRDFRLCWHTIQITLWRQVYDKQVASAPPSTTPAVCTSHGEFVDEVEAVRQVLRVDLQLGGLVQQCECPAAEYSRVTKIGKRCHQAVISFRCLERVIQTWVAPPP